jgi:signal transduction histidine kinase
MNDHSLISTERRLVSLFVGWAFLFLILFEGLFIIGRAILENRFQTEIFNTAVVRILERWKPSGANRNMQKPPIWVGFVIIDGSGNIIENKLGGREEITEYENYLDKDILLWMGSGITISYNGLLLRKVAVNWNPSFVQIFIGRWGYPLEDILRDILRFLAMDLLILLPFWFMGRYFVRQILKPVAENIDTMNHFIHDAGHELKTPLAIISGNLQILRDSKKQYPSLIEESISTIHTMSDSLSWLLELSSVKLSVGKKSTELKVCMDEVLHFLEKEIQKKELKISMNIAEKKKLPIDPKHMAILFSNLIRNAITYNRVWGSINISMKGSVIEIEDTGIGMDQETMERIFERFYRADRSGKNSGTGIWLTIVDRIVKLYGWKIRVKSELWVGTTFSIETK